MTTVPLPEPRSGDGDYPNTGWCICGRPNIYCDGHDEEFDIAHKRTIHITKANAQNGARKEFWQEFRKTEPIRARYIGGAFTVETREGVLDAPEGGWLALDADGWPYPIDADVFDRTYDEVKA